MTPDEVRQEGGAGAEPPRRRKTGPRHAVPKKPLLTRLHVPAGKAIALAAMPSAVLMGMGLTPKLAIAEPLPKNPFKDGPCVTAPDREVEEDEAGASESPAPGTSPAPEAGAPVEERPGTDTGPGNTGSGGGSGGSGSDTSDPAPGSGERSGPDAGVGEPGSEPGSAPEPEPSPSRTTEEKNRNPLDPLGLGDALRDLLTPGKKDGKTEEAAEEPEASPSASPSPSPSAGSDGPARDTAENAGNAGNSGNSENAGKVEKGVRDLGDAVREGAEKVGEGVENAGEDEEPDASPEPDASGKEPYPCPTHDAEALANAEDEQTEAVLPNAPWRLETSLLTLHGLDYHGIVKVRTQNGTVKNVLKFTAKAVDIRDLHQLVDGPGGTTAHVKAAKGSTSTIRKGTVTMYTEELKGRLFGLIPITFSPESPPPLNVPEVFFTEVSVKQAGQFGGELHIPGMQLYNEG